MSRNTSGLVKLDEAARQLGCHVETLRVRVRAGSLKAIRGPHGAYYIAPAALRSLDGIRHVRRPVQVTDEAMERSWAALESISAPSTRTVLHRVRHATAQDKPVHRLVAVHRLAAIGLTFDQIAAELGITDRHVRRLYRKSLWAELEKWWARRWAADLKRRKPGSRRTVARPARRSSGSHVGRGG